MEKYSEPQIYVIDNEQIADKLSDIYSVVYNGTLGKSKNIKYSGRVQKRYINFKNEILANIHEYKVIIIDLQSERECVVCKEDESPINPPYLMLTEYPKNFFEPAPLELEYICRNLSKECIRIIFADLDYVEEYKFVKILGKYEYSYPEERNISIYSTIGANIINKQGKKISKRKHEHKLATVISKYTKGYRAVFDMPTIWDKTKREYISDDNYIPVLFNEDEEVISYIGYDSETGYELILPYCDNKEKLIEELCLKVLPDICDKIFTESKEFNWIERTEFKHKEILECENKLEILKKEYDNEVAKIEIEKTKINEKYAYLRELLTETGQNLVNAVKKYFEWLGFENVFLVYNTEDTLREDIQIIDGDDVFIIEVKGIGGTSTDSECSQIAKHRRRREREYKGKEVWPIYIVNHQRYMNPSIRENPPFSTDQIEYAKNDERGLLTTWQMYQQYKWIEDDIFTKDETRVALKQWGVITLVPNNVNYIGKVDEYYKQPNACIVKVENEQINSGDIILIKKDEKWDKAKIESIQVDGNNVEEAANCEVGIVFNKKMGKGYELYKRTI